MLTVIFGLMVITASIWYFNRPQHHTPMQQASSSAPKPEPVKPVMLTLPGAKPITALHQDYNSPTSEWVVASKDHPLPDPHYRPADLVVPNVAVNTSKSTDEQSVNKQITPAVEALFAAAKQNGYELMVASGFRSYELQNTYFTHYAATYGYDEANKFSALPGQSEHQTGWTLDVSLTSRECYLDACFGDMPAGKWLAAHAAEYGFIIRYPADKTAITKYSYEPWHIRYVGTDLAGALKQGGLTLDEAYPALQKALTELKKRGEV